MRIALAQINPIVGDIAGNVAKMIDAIDRAADDGAELTVFSELSLCGYPPRDLLLKPKFVADTLSALDVLAKHCTGTAALVGHVRPNDSPTGRLLLNAAALLADGACMATHVKTLLPSYDVFDETRYFEPGPAPRPLLLGKHRIGDHLRRLVGPDRTGPAVVQPAGRCSGAGRRRR